MQWAMQPMWKEKSMDVCEWYIFKVLQILHKTSVEHRVESIQILIKTTLFITSCQSQSATGNKTWTSAVPNFVNHLAQSCVGSNQRSFVNVKDRRHWSLVNVQDRRHWSFVNIKDWRHWSLWKCKKTEDIEVFEM